MAAASSYPTQEIDKFGGLPEFSFFCPDMDVFPPTIFDHLLVILLGVALPLFAVFRSQPGMKNLRFDTPTKIALYWGNSLSLWVATLSVGLVWWFSGRAFAELGFQPPRTSASSSWPWLTAAFVLLYLFDCVFQLSTPERRTKTKAHWRKNTPFLPQTGRELRHFSFLAISAAFGEEVIFRTYFISYLLFFMGNTTTGKVSAVLIPAAVFAFSHFYQEWKAVLKIVAMAVLFGAIFLLARSLWVLISLHFLVDLGGGLLAMRMLRGEEKNLELSKE